ncbi:hypothetical protein FS749_002142 [Ceratobasidium sp. UAMH 11750]|nr:hypothetical protein FS749_002142 [Ceratobasidium sp. UAMH 11750]
MAAKTKQSLKQSINRIKGLFDRSPGSSQPSTSSIQLASTPPTPVPNPQPVPEVLGQPSAPPAAPIPPAPDGAKHKGWAELKTFANLLGNCAPVFDPLKRVMGGVLMCIETFESVGKNSEDYQRLRTDLNALSHDLLNYFGDSTPPEMRSSIANLARGIEQGLELICTKTQDENKVARYIMANKDAENVLTCYRRIQEHFERFMINANISTWKIVAERTMEARLEKLPNSPAAMYRSAKSSNLRAGCTPETRVQVLEQLRDWAYDDKSEKIYWMNGMAGTGKTTIAYTLCERLEVTQQLAASFFCSRQLPECRDVNRIVPTISYQLARFSRPFRYAVSRVLEKNPDAHNQLLLEQFKKLVLEPLNQVKPTLPIGLIVVIDALDECDSDGGDGILDVLLSSAQELPVKFFVASRPEAKILDRMGNRGGHTELRLHELARSSVQEDIRGYLTTKFKSSPMTISAHDLDTLIARSGVLFIYAATVVRYIGRDNFARGAKRLAEVLSAPSGSSGGSHKGIDALYTAILEAAFDDPDLPELDLAEMKLVLDTIICAQEPLSLNVIAGLLGLDSGESAQAALRPLRSVLHISDTTHIATTLHESFPDYLRNKGRSGRFHCDMDEQNARLARLCFDRINISSPPFNICNLESSYVFDKDIPDSANRVEKAISEGLFYACRYWDAHLRLAKESQNLADILFDFLSNRLLLWMEMMNLKKRIHDGRAMLDRMQEWSQSVNWLDENTKLLFRDGWMFISSFSSSPAILSTPHLYVSTLSFWPKDRPISKHYPQQWSHIINEASTAMSTRGATPPAVINTGHEIDFLEYSPYGSYTAPSPKNKIMHIWDAHTIAYSPDGAYILSGSHDRIIRIWDARTAQSVGQPLQGHTGLAKSVAYPPDSACTVFGSSENAPRIRDVHPGVMVGNVPASGNNLAGTTAPSHSIPDAQYIEPHICSSCCRTNGPHIAWTLTDDGWVVIHKSKLLVWIPSDLRVILLSPQNTAVTSTRGVLRLDFDHRRIGDHWQKHFRPEGFDRAMALITV